MREHPMLPAPEGQEDWPARDNAPMMGEPWPEPTDIAPQPAPRSAPRARDNRPKPPPRRARPVQAGGSAPQAPAAPPAARDEGA
jgi:hypothetical protein